MLGFVLLGLSGWNIGIVFCVMMMGCRLIVYKIVFEMIFLFVLMVMFVMMFVVWFVLMGCCDYLVIVLRFNVCLMVFCLMVMKE